MKMSKNRQAIQSIVRMGVDNIRKMILRITFGLIYEEPEEHLIIFDPKGIFYAKLKSLSMENDLSNTLTYNNIFNWTL